jgi:isoleucyl-tRNA synthetase
VSSEEYRDDIKVSDEILKQVSDSYRKIRNTIRYMLGNLNDFDPEQNSVACDELPELDRWALAKFDELLKKVKKNYDRYEFHSIFQSLNYFCGITMSSFYLDILKDRLYVSGTDSLLRRSAQTVLFTILDGLLRLLSPVLCFTAEEAWNHLYSLDRKAPLEKGIFFAEFPDESGSLEYDVEMMRKWEELIKVRSEITKALEIARREKVIGHSLEAEVLLQADGELEDFIESEWDTVIEISIVSSLSRPGDGVDGGILFESEELKGLKVRVVAASGEKCERCWIRSVTVGENQNHPKICRRCSEVVS